MFKHCDFLVVTMEEADSSTTNGETQGSPEVLRGPEAWITFQAAYGGSDITILNSMRKPPGEYQLDFAMAASNARTIYRTAHICFKGWRDNEAEMFSVNGGLRVTITKTENPPVTKPNH
jgi:hypothetical protein